MISLDNLVSFTESASPAAIYRYNRAVSATIQGTPAPGKTLGDGIAEPERIAEKVLPANFLTSLAGRSRDFAESSSSLLFAFLLALVIIYLVLAARFESFRDPFIIILTVPLSVWITDQTLNVFSQIGIIMLIGIVTKRTKMAAVLEASVSRFRPILMTSLATVFRILPIALSIGALGFLTLFVVPAVYAICSRESPPE